MNGYSGESVQTTGPSRRRPLVNGKRVVAVINRHRRGGLIDIAHRGRVKITQRDNILILRSPSNTHCSSSFQQIYSRIFSRDHPFSLSLLCNISIIFSIIIDIILIFWSLMILFFFFFLYCIVLLMLIISLTTRRCCKDFNLRFVYLKIIRRVEVFFLYIDRFFLFLFRFSTWIVTINYSTLALEST